jgi:hypothetical protein
MIIPIIIIVEVISMLIFVYWRMQPLVGFFYYFDVFAFMLAWIMPIVMVVRLAKTDSFKYFDDPKKNRSLMDFLYRDGTERSIYGERMPGTSFFSVLKLGVLADLGRFPAPGSVYWHGNKPKRFVLQDMMFTGNPKFAGFHRFLAKLGFNNMGEVQTVLNGYNAQLMVKIWNNLIDYKEEKPEDKLIREIQTMSKEDVAKWGRFTKKPKDDMGDNIDKLFLRKQKND